MVVDLDTTITIQGMSGNNYIFNVYGFNKFSDLYDAFKSISALYAFTRRLPQGIGYTHDVVRISDRKAGKNPRFLSGISMIRKGR